MQSYFAVLTIVLMLVMILTRVSRFRETTRDSRDALRQYRQDGFPDSTLRSVLFLSPVCPCFSLADYKHARILSFQNHLMDWSFLLPDRANAVVVESNLVWTEFLS